MEFKVSSPNVRYSAETIEADYLYQTTDVSVEGSQIKVKVRGLPLMTSAKFQDFLTPLPPCPQIHATSLTEVAYYVCF